MLEADLRLRAYLAEGVYTWFRPIEATLVERAMVEYNKTLHQKREEAWERKKTRLAKDGLVVEQAVDAKGQPYIDYILDEESCKLLQAGKEEPGKNKKGSQFTFTEKQWSHRLKGGNLALKETFHLYLLGLDIYNSTRSHLRSAVYDELNRKIGKISLDNIQFIDPHSLVSTSPL